MPNFKLNKCRDVLLLKSNSNKTNSFSNSSCHPYLLFINDENLSKVYINTN